MSITLRPEMQRFVDDEVAAGHYASPEEMVEVALRAMSPEIDDATMTLLEEADADIEAGRGISLDEFKATWQAKLAKK